MDDRYDRDTRGRRNNDYSGEQASGWRDRVERDRKDWGGPDRDAEGRSRGSSSHVWPTGNDRTGGARSTPYDRDHESRGGGRPRQSGYGSDYYARQDQTGDYFGPGDFGSGSHAYAANWDRGYGATGGSYGAGQSVQRDSRRYGDRQMGGSYEPGEGYARETGERGFLERATDEVMSWWGDDDAARRRAQDHAGKGPSDYTRSDERIREDANDRLTDDWRVDARAISVLVDKGEVTLSGTVPTRAEKHRAEECVERISGVRHVQNNLRVSETGTAGASQG